MKTFAIATLSGLVLAGGGTITAMAGSAASTPTSNCDSAWVGTGSIAGINADGRPEGYRAGDASALYVWHDCDGWHIRTTDPVAGGTAGFTYTGVVSTNGKYSRLVAFRLEGGDHLNQTAPSSFAYRFSTHQWKDGSDWRTTGSSLTFDVSKSPGRNLSIVIGKEKATPSTAVFTFVRVTASPGSAGSTMARGSVHVRGVHSRAGALGARGFASMRDRRESVLHLMPLDRKRI